MCASTYVSVAVESGQEEGCNCSSAVTRKELTAAPLKHVRLWPACNLFLTVHAMLRGIHWVIDCLRLNMNGLESDA